MEPGLSIVPLWLHVLKCWLHIVVDDCSEFIIHILNLSPPSS